MEPAASTRRHDWGLLVLAMVLVACAERAAREPAAAACTHCSPACARACRDAGASELRDADDEDASAPQSDAGARPAGAREMPVRIASVLPLEVLGAPGTAVGVRFALASADLPRRDAALELTIHNIVAPDCAEVSINDATAVDLSARSGPWLSALGEVRTGRVPIDRRALRAGENTIVLRYTRQIQDLAAVSGFRVLALALVLDGTRIALDLPFDRPASFAPVRADSGSIDRGRMSFQRVSRDGGPACARCHALSGADLQYYAFSNYSIIERAKFHRFSQREAEDIASFVRAAEFAPAGRPYDPPFQPGAGNHGAAGAGYGAALADDAAFSRSLFGASELPRELAWDYAQAIEPFTQAAPVAAPTWMRWLPRELPEDWFARDGGALARAEQQLEDTPTLASAQSFMGAALALGKKLLMEDGDYDAKVNVLRFAAIKLWDWSRKNGFDHEDHGMPAGSPAYPYEVGFAFFEAALADVGIANAYFQALSWWWAQLASNPGRALSSGRRPLNYQDVLSVAESAGAGPTQIAFLHLYGSWEESRGTLADAWGTDLGPARLLTAPLRALSPSGRETILRRFFDKETQEVSAGGVLGGEHHSALSQAWAVGCAALSGAQRAALRLAAPREVRADLAACP